jgi:hypothetical protein
MKIGNGSIRNENRKATSITRSYRLEWVRDKQEWECRSYKPTKPNMIVWFKVVEANIFWKVMGTCFKKCWWWKGRQYEPLVFTSKDSKIKLPITCERSHKFSPYLTRNRLHWRALKVWNLTLAQEYYVCKLLQGCLIHDILYVKRL